MIVAVPLFGEEVSPRFGYANEVLVADISSGEVQSVRRLAVPGRGGMQICSLILSVRPDAVVCGGIHPRWQQMLERQRVTVFWGVIGRAEDALGSYAAGNLRRDQFVCPRRSKRRGGRQGRRGFQRK